MKVAFFGSSLVSAWWNGAATYYRGLVRALHARGHEVTFYEPDAWGRQEHRDIEDPDYARVVVWKGERALAAALEEAEGADLVVKASGIGVADRALEDMVLTLQSARRRVVYWDVDAPATLARVRSDPDDPFRRCIPEYDVVFTYGGGPPVVDGYASFGARRCVPVYNAHDPDTHHPVPPDARFGATVAFLGNRLPDRDERVESLFFAAARALPRERFVLGGNGWGDRPLPPNVRWVGHVYSRDHNAFNASTQLVLNIARDDMAAVGWSPATRVFEAAGAAACVVTDAWRGVEDFFAPGEEILVARDVGELVAYVRELDAARRTEIGEAARARALRDHTYDHRAAQVESVLAALAEAP